MTDPTRGKQGARGRWLAACCAVVLSLATAGEAAAVVRLTVSTTDGVPGQNVALSWVLTRSGTDPVVAGAQMDIIFDSTQLVFGSCTKAPRLTQQMFGAELPDFQDVPAPLRRLRLAVSNDPQHPSASFDSGALATCTFAVQNDASVGQAISLSSDARRVQVTDPNFDPIPGVEVVINAGRIVSSLPTPTPTPTGIPCFFDRDCPLGQVCDPVDRVCKPAPTPTPTIPCTEDEDCPTGLTCVDGVCRDLSTPTPTPTPLKTCTTDEECVQLEGPGYHCRANVCVPIRECDDEDPVLDRVLCRGEREACVNNACECGGDCNLDGYVFGNETSQMICVLTGQCPLSECAAGDFNGDGEITGNEVCTAVTNLGLGCPGEGQPLTIDRSGEIRSLDVGSASGFPGESVAITVNLSGGGDVATAQLDLLFEEAVLEIPDPETDCEVDARLAATDAAFTFLPQTPDTPPGKVRLRLFVGDINLCRDGLSFPLGAFDVGPLVSCTFRIRSDAPAGDSTLLPERLNIGDPHGAVFGAVSMAGAVRVLSTTGPTPTETAATPTETAATATPTETPTPSTPVVSPTDTPTSGPTFTPTVTGTAATATPTGTLPTATATGTAATATPTGTAATATPTGTRPTATPTPTATQAAPVSDRGDESGCAVATTSPSGFTMLWLVLPVGILVVRRRGRR